MIEKIKNMMKRVLLLSMALIGWVAFGATVEVVECGKCPFRMRIAEDGKSAKINKARLTDDNPSARELEKRIAYMKKRAESLLVKPDPNKGAHTRPMMGWSSWNTFSVNISEDLIISVAQVMATNGLKDAGFNYVNIDDGFFGGRDKNGKLQFHKTRFPNGLKKTVDTIHGLGMKAGIYSDGGHNTCASGSDKGGIGAGLYKHDQDDCNIYFKELGFDFFKVDYCGGAQLGLDEKVRFKEIRKAMDNAGGKNVRLNLCRGVFLGSWMLDVVDSWRISGDIRANWDALKRTIRGNLHLSAYARPGKYNDMDMLEVGHLKGITKTAFADADHGFTREEEITHFGLWSMFSSPLILGCDPRVMPLSTIELVTNPYLLAMNQNDLGLQPYVAAVYGEAGKNTDAYVFVKDADKKFGKARYVAIVNLADLPREVIINARDIDLGGNIDVLDLVERADPGSFKDKLSIWLAPHAAKFYRFDAEERLDREIYEAEDAFLTEFALRKTPNGPYPVDNAAFPFGQWNMSKGHFVKALGHKETNDLIWNDVYVSKAGEYELVIEYTNPTNGSFGFVQVDGGEKIRCELNRERKWVISAKLSAGAHTVRISNSTGRVPDIDYMKVIRK